MSSAAAIALPADEEEYGAASAIGAEHASSGNRDRPVAAATSAEPLAASWLSAFAAAERALLDRACPLSAPETRKHLQRLRCERGKIAGLLETIAHGQRGAMLLIRCLTLPGTDIRLLRLPAGVSACIFDVEGTLTTSAQAHRDAWRLTLDSFLLARAEPLGRRVAPFDPNRDYADYLAGRPRLSGLRTFLASRAITLPEGEPSDRPGTESVHGLANRKLEALRQYFDQQGVDAFAGARAYLEVAEIVGARRAVVSASTNTALILQRAGIDGLIEEQIDGNTLEADSLEPKPAPDTLLAACSRLGVEPAQAAAFETTPDGIAAARAADIRTVIAVAGDAETSALAAAGADIVINDLGEMLERNGS